MKLTKKCIQLLILNITINEINQIKHDNDSSLSIIHTNIASISKYFDDLEQVLSIIKTKFHIIGISEHRLSNQSLIPELNIDLPGYHPFIFDSSKTFCEGTGLFIKNTLVYKIRRDLKITSTSSFESTFIELIFPKKKNMIIGRLYRQIPISQFTDDYLEP